MKKKPPSPSPGDGLPRVDPTPRPAQPEEIFAALAEEPDLVQVRERFGLTDEDLQELFGRARDIFEATAPSWTLYVDGACRDNPGPAGAGAVLLDPEGRVRAQESRFLGRATNNIAEYQGLLLGLAAARALGVNRLDIYSDSELMVRQLHGVYQVKSRNLLPLWQEARKQLQSLEVYAIRHVDRSFNQEADRLARRAIDQALRRGYNKT
ncbi:MAG: ribonuclease HI family protein [Deltaproteobacteria bacterium]|nr:ribonuclease HI family protein [Deltaproteobacteria bacterium]